MFIYLQFRSRIEGRKPRSHSRVWTWAPCQTHPSSPARCRCSTRPELQVKQQSLTEFKLLKQKPVNYERSVNRSNVHLCSAFSPTPVILSEASDPCCSETAWSIQSPLWSSLFHPAWKEKNQLWSSNQCRRIINILKAQCVKFKRSTDRNDYE